ncbi:ferredoxin [Monashia sp. NPDC004114]
MDIAVDRERCVGSGQCVMRMPDVFTSDDAEGLVELIDPAGAGHEAADVDDVAFSCPAQAIMVAADA